MKKLMICISMMVVFHANIIKSQITVLPALSQKDDGSRYSATYGAQNSQNLCGWYAVFFLEQMLLHVNNKPVLEKNLQDRAMFDTFLASLVGSGKPFEYLKKNGLEFVQKNKEFDAKRAPARQALIEARSKFPEDSKEVQYKKADLALVDANIKKEKDLWVEQNPSMTLLPDTILQEVAKRVLARTNNVCIYASYGLVTNAPKVLPFPVIFNTGPILQRNYGHWIAGLFVNNTLLIADSLGQDRTQDLVITQAYSSLKTDLGTVVPVDAESKKILDALITSLTNLKNSLSNLSIRLHEVGSRGLST